jgi:hypothetical protein
MLISREDIIATSERWYLPPPASAAQLHELETLLGFPLPPELRELLSIADGLLLPHPAGEDPALGLPGLYSVALMAQNTRHFRAWWFKEHRKVKGQFDDHCCLLIANRRSGDYAGYYYEPGDGGHDLATFNHETGEIETLEGSFLKLLADLAEN